MPSLGNFLHTQLILKIPIPSASFTSKTVIITGASSGLGKEAARHIVRLGASKVILGCRNTSKGDETKREIEDSLECNTDILEVWQVDVESAESIKAFVDRANKLARLDVLINNAGIATNVFQTVFETERTIAVNVVGTFLLALQLIPKLKETGKTYGVTPHLTFVGSALYDIARYPENHEKDIFSWLSNKSNVTMVNQYNLSKLLQLYVITKLASIVDPKTASSESQDSQSIVINCLDPCLCKTGLAGDISGPQRVFRIIIKALFARTAEEGSRLIVIAASAGRETHGGYMRAGALQAYAPFVTDEQGVRKSENIWEALGAKLEKLQPGILQNVKTA